MDTGTRPAFACEKRTKRKVVSIKHRDKRNGHMEHVLFLFSFGLFVCFSNVAGQENKCKFNTHTKKRLFHDYLIVCVCVCGKKREEKCISMEIEILS